MHGHDSLTGGPRGRPALRYDAFISYSHAGDDHVAPRLQDALGRLAKPWWRRRALRVFRDRTGLSANPGLWSSIEAAMDESEWFVLLASPESARSPWVGREVAHWLATRSPDRLLVVVTDGSWAWDPTQRRVDPASTAAPEALLGAFAEEPRHVDLTWARSEQQLDLRNGRFRDVVAELAAPIHGMPKDELEGADLREHRRTVRWVWTAALVLVTLAVVASVAGSVAVRQADEASAARTEAQRRAADAEFQRLVAEARNQIGVDRELAFLLALEANRLRPTPASRSVLLAALQQERNYLGPIRTHEQPWSAAALDERTAVYGTRSGEVARADLDDGTVELTRQLGDGEPGGVDVSDDPTRTGGDPVVALRRDTGQIWQLDPTSLEPLGSPTDTGGPALCLASSRRLGVAAVCSADGTVPIVDLATGAIRTRFPAAPTVDDPLAVVAASDAEEVFAAGGAVLGADDATAVAFSPTDDIVAVSRSGGAVELWTTSGRALSTIAGGEADYYIHTDLEFRRDGTSIVQADFSGFDRLRSIDTATGEVTWSRSLEDQTEGPHVDFSPSGDTLAVAKGSGELELVDPDDGDTIRVVGDLPPTPAVGLLAVDDRRLVAIDGEVRRLWRFATDGRGRIVRVLGSPGQLPFEISPSGRRLVAWEGPGPVFYDNSLWDLDSGEELIPRLPVGRSIPIDDTTLVAFYDDLTAGRFDVTTMRRLEPAIPFDPLAWTTLTWNLPAGLVAVGYPDRFDVFDVAEGRQLDLPPELADPLPTKLDFDDSGRFATAYESTTATIRDLRTGERILGPITDVWDVAHARDGSVFIAGTDGRIERRDLRSGRLIRTYVERGQPAELKVGASLFVAARLGEWALFDIDSGVQLGDRFPIAATPAGYSNGAVTPDDRVVVLAGEHGMEVWDLRTDSWRAAACALAGRNLTRSEWDRYLPAGEPRRPTC